MAQTAAILEEHIASRPGGEKLASERELCHQLGVSRLTLRTALARLAREGVLRAGRGRRRVIVGIGSSTRRPSANRDVIVLSPCPLHGVEPRVLFWIDEVRDALARENYRLDVVCQRNCYTERPQRALEELAARLRPAVWLLYLSTPAMQEWFFARSLPVVIAGSRYEGVQLPCVDVDYRALCLHAAGRFIAKGHRCLALLNPKSMAAGDLESEAGFSQAATVAGKNVETLIEHHGGRIAEICAGLNRLLNRPRPPTAFLVSRATHALTALGYLVQQGLRFPGEAAFIARDHDSFLEHVIPSVARYQADPLVFAHRLSRVVLEITSGGNARAEVHRLMPRLLPGQTLG